jgi:Gas vesicle synthesis protein GvpL/GvpF
MATRSSDDSLQRLRAALTELTAGDAAKVIDEAHTEARERVRSMLTDAMAHSLIESIEQRLALPPARERPEVQGGHAWYVYGVVGSVQLEAHDELPGVDERHSVTTLHEGTLAAVVSRVSADEFDDAHLRANLSDMAWVEKLARSHEAVLEVTREHATVIPMRMCTVYKTDGGVREMLRREAPALEEALTQLEGRAEWGVKVFVDPASAAPSAEEPGPASLSGAAYMDSRRRDLEHKELAAGRLQEAAHQIHERLCELATDGLVSPPQRPEASGYAGEMILNGAYLVEDVSAQAFGEEVSRLEEQFISLGLTLVLTGPWPPYNFVPGAIGAAW